MEEVFYSKNLDKKNETMKYLPPFFGFSIILLTFAVKLELHEQNLFLRQRHSQGLRLRQWNRSSRISGCGDRQQLTAHLPATIGGFA